MVGVGFMNPWDLLWIAGLYLTRSERDGVRWALDYLKTALQVFTTLRSTFISPSWLIIIVRIGSKLG
jgi:hypothetical protein